MKAIFGWDYNIWCRCHYCGEFGHIGMNCVEHHMRKRDTMKRCFNFIEICHLAKNWINIGKIEDENNEKNDNIQK